MRTPLLVALFALRLFGGCHGEQKKNAPHQQPPTAVRVAAVTVMDAPITVTASGVVEPLQTVAVQAQVSGALLAVEFKEGDYVRAGQVLFRIEAGTFEAAAAQARAALVRDEAQAVAARRSDVRYQTLVREDYVSREQADQVHAAALAADATVAADRAVLRAAEVSLGYATIRAPISGRTGALLSRMGDIVGPGSGPLVVINQMQPVLIRFPVVSQDLPLLRTAVAQHPLPVTASSADSTAVTEHGELSFLDNAVDSTSGTVTAKARFANTGSRLWPGELVFLTVRAGTERGALVLPTTAIVVGQQGPFVYVVDEQRRVATVRTIVAGRTAGAFTVVQSGLKPGEWVVTDGQSQLKPGAHVAVIGAPPGAKAAAPASTAGVAGAPGALWSGAGAPTGRVVGAPGAAVQPNVGGVPPAQQAPATTTGTTTTGTATTRTTAPSPVTPGTRAPATSTPAVNARPATSTTTTTTTTSGTRGGATGTSTGTSTGTGTGTGTGGGPP